MHLFSGLELTPTPHSQVKMRPAHCSTDSMMLGFVQCDALNSTQTRRNASLSSTAELATVCDRPPFFNYTPFSKSYSTGRHAFATLIHQAQAQWSKNLHMTLLDIHPSITAKLLITFRLLEQAASATGTEEAELYMTLVGLSRCLVVPKYCAER
jgi:hypothetical protein